MSPRDRVYESEKALVMENESDVYREYRILRFKLRSREASSALTQYARRRARGMWELIGRPEGRPEGRPSEETIVIACLFVSIGFPELDTSYMHNLVSAARSNIKNAERVDLHRLIDKLGSASQSMRSRGQQYAVKIVDQIVWDEVFEIDDIV
jgi:hypothetical protein